MPYVKQELRDQVDADISILVDKMERATKSNTKQVAGLFTYVVYRLAKWFFTGRYWERALGVGCLVCCILELYRREHSAYEDKAIERNGDV